MDAITGMNVIVNQCPRPVPQFSGLLTVEITMGLYWQQATFFTTTCYKQQPTT